MKLRSRGLPRGWYPSSAQETRAFIEGLSPMPYGTARNGTAVACVAPHAGWTFSLAVAYRALVVLDASADTVVVFGGHLPSGRRPLLALEDGAETPLGSVEFDSELRSALAERFPFDEDRYPDNTVEVHLPVLKYLFPRSRVLWARLPAQPSSYDVGADLVDIGKSLGRRLVVVGSTDLTHYGPNYGFMPKGLGAAAEAWVREVNDRAFLDSVLSGDAEGVLSHGEGDFAACSSGAVLGAMGYAHAVGASSARLESYGTSADAVPGTSFVSYAALTWSR